MVNVVHQQGRIRHALTPEPAPAQRRVCQRHRIVFREQPQPVHVRPRILIDPDFLFEPHPVGPRIVGREDDPLCADLFEVLKDHTIVFQHGRLIHVGVVDKLGDDQIRLERQNLFCVVVRAARRLVSKSGRRPAAPARRQHDDAGFGEPLTQPHRKLLLPLLLERQIHALGDAVAPRQNLHSTSALEFRQGLGQQTLRSRKPHARRLRVCRFENRKQICGRQLVNAAGQPDIAHSRFARRQFRRTRRGHMRYSPAQNQLFAGGQRHAVETHQRVTVAGEDRLIRRDRAAFQAAEARPPGLELIIFTRAESPCRCAGPVAHDQ